MPCCPSHGPDACGASLFCAAFDGRKQPTCYVERSRLDRTECEHDLHCVSGSCNSEQKLCRSLPGASCDATVGCAPAPTGQRLACAKDTGICMPITGQDGGLCELASDCNSGHCVSGTCSSGSKGATCTGATDCGTGVCVFGSCRDGAEGSPCQEPAHCKGGSCIGGKCSSGQSGSNCEQDSHCSAQDPFCVYGKCSSGWFGDSCHNAGDCDPQYPHCTAGKCDDGVDLGDPCTTTAQCVQPKSSLGKPIPVVCDASKKTCVAKKGGKCDQAWSKDKCETGTSCQPDDPNPGTCAATGKACTGSYCCGPAGCTYGCSDGWACL